MDLPNVEAEKAKCDSYGLAIGFGIVGLALLLRLHRIAEQELGWDEAFSVLLSTTHNGLGQALRLENSPPAYYLVLRFWTVVMGSSEFSVRFLSAVCGTLFVATILWVGRAILNARVAFWSGLFVAVAPVHIYDSQEARPYLFGPLILIWLSSFYRPTYVVGRHDIRVFPAYALLVGIGLAKVQAMSKSGPVEQGSRRCCSSCPPPSRYRCTTGRPSRCRCRPVCARRPISSMSPSLMATRS